MQSYTVRRLTRDNVEALKVVKERGILGEGESLSISATTATFTMEKPREWLIEMRDQIAAEFGKRGRPHQSLHAVVRKLMDAMESEEPEKPTDEGPEALRDLLKLD